MKYLVVAIEYFTKWIEAELVAQITIHKITHFVWKNIVYHFGVPKRLVSDNGTQFCSFRLTEKVFVRALTREQGLLRLQLRSPPYAAVST